MKTKQYINTLNTIRKSKGITNTDIVNATGLHKANVSLFFNHKRKPLLCTFIAIMKACEVTFSELEQ